jgi:hypothetical protein
MPDASANEPAPAAPPARTSRRRRWVAALGLVLLALLVLGSIGAYYLDTIARETVLSYGPEATGVPVRLGSLEVSLTGSLRLTDLVLGTPEGYQAPYSIRIEELTAAASPLALLGGSLAVDSFSLRGVEMNCETGPGRSNISEIQDHLRAFLAARGYGAGTEGEAAGAPLGVLVDEGRAERITVRFNTPQSGGRGPEVHIKEMTVRATAERVEKVLTGLTVSNPPRFSDNPAIEAETVTIQADPRTVLAETLVIESIEVDQVRALYETSVTGSNITHIQGYVDGFVRTMSRREEGDPTQRVLIRDFRLTHARATLSPSLLQGKVGVPVPVPSMHFEEIEGASLAAALRALIDKVMPGFEGAGSGLLEGLKTVGDAATTGGKALGGAVLEGGKALGGAAVEGVKKLGGLFRRGGEDDGETTEETTGEEAAGAAE